MATSEKCKNRWRIVLTVVIFIIVGPTLVGFPAFSAAAMDEGVYENVCPNGSEAKASAFHEANILNITVKAKCEEQQLKFNLMLILFTSFANVTPVISSICSLIIKPKYLAMIGGCIMTTGYLLFAFSTPYFEAYEVGSAIIGFGYSVCFLPLFSVAFREPGWTHIVYPLIVEPKSIMRSWPKFHNYFAASVI